MRIFTEQALKEYAEAVSYTHLDVYKRQLQQSLMELRQNRNWRLMEKKRGV